MNRIVYDKQDGMPVCEGEINALIALDQAGRLPRGTITQAMLADLLGCQHEGGREPCAICLGYESVQEMAAELASGQLD